MPQHRVECDCGFEEQSVDTETKNGAFQVMEDHQENCEEFVTVWEAIHTSQLLK